MIYFLKQLSKNWIALLGLIPALYDLVGAYLPWDFEFPKFIIYSFATLALLYAAYQTFDEEHKKRKALEKKLEGPTDYKITCLLTPINFDEEKLLKRIDEIKEEAVEKIESLHPIKEKSTSNSTKDSISSLLDNLRSFDHMYYTKTSSQYNRELDIYKNELRNIVNKIDDFKNKLHITLLSWKEEYYFVQFKIENIGITSDTDIQVDIICEDETIVFKRNDVVKYGLDIVKLIPSIPKEPEEPKLEPLVKAGFNNGLNFDHRYNIPTIPNQNAFRKQIRINDKRCSVTIRDLHVGDQIDLFRKTLIIKKTSKEINFKAIIKSKESTRVLTPTVSIEYQESYRNFFETTEDN